MSETGKDFFICHRPSILLNTGYVLPMSDSPIPIDISSYSQKKLLPGASKWWLVVLAGKIYVQTHSRIALSQFLKRLSNEDTCIIFNVHIVSLE